MNNFAFGGGGGGKKRRNEFIGGRPRSDANYGPKKKKDFGNKPSFRGGDRFERGGEKTLFATTCTTCGKPCEVPFRPDGSKPVLCRDCFAKNHPADRSDSPRGNKFDRGNDRGFRKPERTFTPTKIASPDTAHHQALAKQMASIETKLDALLTLLSTTKKAMVTATPEEAATSVASTATVAPAKKTKVAKKVAAPKKVAKKATKKAAKKVAKKAA